MNGSYKTITYRNDGMGHDTVTATAQFKLKKGDIVDAWFHGNWYNPANSKHAYFEGHLIRKINE